MATTERVIFQLQADTKQALREIKAMRAEMDKTTDSVKKTQESTGRLEGSIKNAGKAFAAFASVTVIMATVQRAIRGALQAVSEFETEMAKLSSITGATGKDLEYLKKQAIELSINSTQMAKDVARAFSLVGSAKPELLKSAQALAEVTKQAIILAEAASISVPEAADALTNALNQFGKGAKDAAKFTDILATSQQKGTGRVQYMTAAMTKAGSVAKTLNIDFETTNAILQGFAKGGIQAEIAGTAFSSIMSRLSAQTNKDFNPSMTDAVTVLNNLRDSNLSLNEANKMVGLQMGKYLLTLTSQIDIINELNGALYEQGNAAEQAATNTATLATSWDNLKKNYQNFLLVTTGETGGLRALIQGTADDLGELTKAMDVNTDQMIGASKAWVILTKAAALFGNKDAREALAEYSDLIGKIESDIKAAEEAQTKIIPVIEEEIRTVADIDAEIKDLIEARNGLAAADIEGITAINKQIFALQEEKKALAELGKEIKKVTDEEKRRQGVLERAEAEFKKVATEGMKPLGPDWLLDDLDNLALQLGEIKQKKVDMAAVDEQNSEDLKALKADEFTFNLGLLDYLSKATAVATEEQGVLHKSASITSALINTYLGATAALANTSLPVPLNFLAAAATIAFGLQQVKKIQSFAEGGFTGKTDAGMKDRHGKIAGYVHQDEFVINKQKTALLRPLLEDIHNDRLNVRDLATLTRRGMIHQLIKTELKTDSLERRVDKIYSAIKEKTPTFYDDEHLKIRGNTKYIKR